MCLILYPKKIIHLFKGLESLEIRIIGIKLSYKKKSNQKVQLQQY